ncbi:MAG: hypothetical protein ACHQNA_12955, partial [Acidimicrobiales bacterium]
MRALNLAGLALLACLAVAGCRFALVEGGNSQNGVSVINGTESTLRFRMLVDGQWYELGEGSPDRNPSQLVSYASMTDGEVVARNSCTVGVIVALDPSGK